MRAGSCQDAGSAPADAWGGFANSPGESLHPRRAFFHGRPFFHGVMGPTFLPTPLSPAFAPAAHPKGLCRAALTPASGPVRRGGIHHGDGTFRLAVPRSKSRFVASSGFEPHEAVRLHHRRFVPSTWRPIRSRPLRFATTSALKRQRGVFSEGAQIEPPASIR